MRVAIVGVRHGHIRGVIRHIQASSDHQLTCVVEDDATLRESFATELGVPSYTTLEEMLTKETVDAVGIAPVNSERAQIAARCLEQGLHVIADKPVATTLEDLEALQKAASQSEAILSVRLTLRFSPVYVTACKLVRSGAIGRLVHAWLCRPHKLNAPNRPRWMFARETYGGIFPDLAIHDIDIFRWVTDAQAHQIASMTALHGNYGLSGQVDFEDAGHLLVRLDDGTVGSFEASWLTPDGSPYHGDTRAIFTGTEGTVEALAVEKRVILTTRAHGPKEVPLEVCKSVDDDFFDGIRQGPQSMTLPPHEALESTRWSIMARDLADANHRFNVLRAKKR